MITLLVNGQPHQVNAPRRHAVALGPAGYSGHDRHQIRLRHRAMRRLHRACGRRTGVLLPLPVGLIGDKPVTTIEAIGSTPNGQQSAAGLDRP